MSNFLKRFFTATSTLNLLPAFLAALVAGAILSAMVPPLQSPDEASHLTQAAVISQGSLFGRSTDGRVPGGQLDQQFLPYFENYHKLRGTPNKLTPEIRAAGDALAHSGTTVFAPTHATAYYLPVVYFPQAAGLAIGRWSGLSIDDSIRTARALAFLASLVILFGAVKLYAPNMFVLTIFMLPMMMFQIVCAGIDGITTATAVFALSFFMRSLEKKWQAPKSLLLLFAFSLLVVCTTRQHLVLLLLLPFYLYTVRKERQLLWMGLTLCVLTVAWTLYITSVTSAVAPSNKSNLMYYLNSPSAAWSLLVNSIFNTENIRSYLVAFIGILGWIDTPMQSWFYKVAGLFTIATIGFSLTLKGSHADWSARAFLLFIGLASSLLTFIIMMIVWTKLPATQIEGVQGRYFFVPAILFGFALSGAKIPMRLKGLQSALLCVFALFTVYNTAYVLNHRYNLASASAAVGNLAINAPGLVPTHQRNFTHNPLRFRVITT